MSESSDEANRGMRSFQAYLETLTFIQIDPRLRGKVGWSDLIQKTLIEAWQTLERIEAMDSEAQKRWLRRMLMNNLKDEIDRVLAQIRDVRRERSLEDAVRRSSIRLGDWIEAEQSTPSEQMIEREKERETELRVLEALAQLPQRKRDAVVLKEYHDWKLAEIAGYLECTTNAAAGLYARGLAKLKELLADLE